VTNDTAIWYGCAGSLATLLYELNETADASLPADLAEKVKPKIKDIAKSLHELMSMVD
jgi:hypothetical protein